MEHDSKKIQEVMKQLIILLKENEEIEWADYLNNLTINYVNLDTRDSAVQNILNIYKGGMGSFGDLVLQKNMKMLIEENEKLECLKHNLYNLCLNYFEHCKK